MYVGAIKWRKFAKSYNYAASIIRLGIACELASKMYALYEVQYEYYFSEFFLSDATTLHQLICCYIFQQCLWITMPYHSNIEFNDKDDVWL